MPLLQDKVALVTGGARGIGRAIVKEFLAEGASVYFNYSKSAADAEALIGWAHENGYTKIEATQCSITDPAEVKAMFANISRKGDKIDIVVNNAGITRDGFLMMMSEADWEAVIRTNLFGMFYTSKTAVRSMAARKSGCIINIASVAAIHGSPGQSNYAASKGGIIAFTKSTAMELIGSGIRVNCILPGFIETDMTHKLPPDMRKEIVRQVPCGRMGKPEEVAHLAAFLASDRATYIVGQSIVMDGGLTRGANG